MIRLALLALATCLLAACGRPAEPVYAQQSYVFGTLVEITTWGVPAERAAPVVGEVLREFDRLHAELHPWQDGTLGRINAALARGESAPLEPWLAELLRDAVRLAALSDDLFNPAIGGLVQLWGFHADSIAASRPDPAAVAALVAARPRMADLRLADGRIASRNPAVRIDLGGYAKGYALDLAAQRLRAAGIDNALINVGGNVLALGRRGERSWQVGIRHPRQSGPIASLALYDGEAIGTSGDYQRYFMLDGVRYSHLLDPRNGQPARAAQAATVIATGGVLSDVASKPLFIAGPDGWRAQAGRLGIELALLVDADGALHVTPALRARLTLLDRSARAGD